MSQPEPNAQDVLPTWVDAALLQGMLRGIERESLRMQSDGFLSQQAHPQALGSAYFDTSTWLSNSGEAMPLSIT